MDVHVVLNNRLGIAKLHDGHGIGDRSRDGVIKIVEASVVSQASGVAALPLGPGSVNIGVVEEEERLIGRGGRAHVAKDDAVNLRMRQALEHRVHIGIVVKSVDRVHGLGVVRAGLHITNDGIAVFVVAQAAVELASKAMQAVADRVHIGPAHGERQVGVGKGPVDDAALEAGDAAVCALAIAAKACRGVKDGRVDRVHGVGVDAPVPVRLRSGEAALVAQQVLVQLHEPAVPGEEVGHKVDIRVEGKVRVDQVVHARGDSLDIGVFGLGKPAHAHGGPEVLGLFGVGEFAPLLANGRVGAGICARYNTRRRCCRKGEEGDD